MSTSASHEKPDAGDLVVSGKSHEDCFVSVTSFLKSAQASLNKHRELTNAQLRAFEDSCTKSRAQVAQLQEENLRLQARLGVVDASCGIQAIESPLTQLLDIGVQVDLESLPDECSPLENLQGETGGSAFTDLDDVEIVPQPPSTVQSPVLEPSGPPPSMSPPVNIDSTPVAPFIEGLHVPVSVQELSPENESACGENSDEKSAQDQHMPLAEENEPMLDNIVPTGNPECFKQADIVKNALFVPSNSDRPSTRSSSKGSLVPTDNPECSKQADIVKNALFVPRNSDRPSTRSSSKGSPRTSFNGWFEPKASRRDSETSIKEFASRDILPNKVFADAAAMKEKVRQAIGKPEYNVCDYYWEDGCFQWLARHPRFEQFFLLVILVNSLWIAYDADENNSAVLSQAKPQFQVAEHTFCVLFAIEWIVRFCAFQHKGNCFYDFWFVFDSFMVSVMIVEVWFINFVLTLVTDTSDADNFSQATSLKLLRLFRLTRMARIARLLRTMPELMILIKGMAVAMRSVFFTLCLLGIIIYLFSIFFRQLTDGTRIGESYFKTIPDAMLSLLVRGTLPDLADFVYDVSEDSAFFGFFLLLFILFASLTVMNMLVGVLCEVVTCVSSVEKEQLVVNFVQSQLSKFLLEHMGRSLDAPMSKAQFMELLGRPQAARTLHEVGVDVLGLMEISDFLFKEDKELTFPDFMALVLELRGSNTATVKHIVDLQKFVHMELRKTNFELEKHVAIMLDHSNRKGHRESVVSAMETKEYKAQRTLKKLESQLEGGANPLDSPFEGGAVIGISRMSRGGARGPISPSMTRTFKTKAR